MKKIFFVCSWLIVMIMMSKNVICFMFNEVLKLVNNWGMGNIFSYVRLELFLKVGKLIEKILF